VENTSNRLNTASARRQALDTIATLCFIAVCLGLLWTMFVPRRATLSAGARPAPGRVAPTLPTEAISLDGAPVEGSRTAKVALIEFSDFQCPFCAKFANEIEPGLKREYIDTGKVLMAFRSLPLEAIHPFALKAAESATCAGQQGRYLEMRQALFGRHRELDRIDWTETATGLTLDVAAFRGCMQGQATSRVRQDLASAQQLAVSGTPTFFVGRLGADGKVKVTDRLVGALPLARFADAFEKALKVN